MNSWPEPDLIFNLYLETKRRYSNEKKFNKMWMFGLLVFAVLMMFGCDSGGDSATAPAQQTPATPIFTTFAGNYNFTVAIKSDGTLYAWGDNDYGQLGDGTTDEKHTPTMIGSDSDWLP